GTEGEDRDVAALRVLEADRLFERIFVVRRDDELQSRLIDLLTAGGDFDAGLGVGDVADADDGVQTGDLQRGAILVDGTHFAKAFCAAGFPHRNAKTEDGDAYVEQAA